MGEEQEQEQEQQQQAGGGSRANPITHAQFLSWKRQKDADEAAKQAEEARKRAEDIEAGRVAMNGRELFLREPWVFDNTRY
ncbi:hypothetical protein AMTRI_Chr04g188830 [Amborella trichopoda]